MRQKTRAEKEPIGAAVTAYFIILVIYACFCVGSSIYFFTLQQVRNGVMSLLFILIAGAIELASFLFRMRTRPVFIAGVLLIAAVGVWLLIDLIPGGKKKDIDEQEAGENN